MQPCRAEGTPHVGYLSTGKLIKGTWEGQRHTSSHEGTMGRVFSCRYDFVDANGPTKEQYIQAIRTGDSESGDGRGHWGDAMALTAFADATNYFVVVQFATQKELKAGRTHLYVPRHGLVMLVDGFKFTSKQMEEIRLVHHGWEFNIEAQDVLWLSYRKDREYGKQKEPRAAHFNAIVWRDRR